MILFALLLNAPVDNVNVEAPRVDCLEIRQTMESMPQDFRPPLDAIDAITERCIALHGG